METWPIYVPSRGRAETSSLLKREDGLTIIVEPWEVEAYTQAFGGRHNIVELPDNNRGIAYARNFIKEFNNRVKRSWYWMIDDDITAFWEIVNGKAVKKDMKTVLNLAQTIIRSLPGLGLASIEYERYAWAAKDPIKLNHFCDVVVAVNALKTKDLKYRDVPVKEDRDFALQVLKSGLKTARITKAAFSAPGRGTNKGGLHDVYAKGREREGAEQLAELWPALATVVKKKDGSYDAKINWARAYREEKHG